ncbi:aminotransferase class V-fold PLP-dependent enzyme [Virgibacillus sp. 179-BFC.A HS]|uniref:cysteine desulfurase n=1 Tax=Tigheibacillus jepli TaxID=3035914 RepID=A0ABU5CE46_9BACI|nr:aminotransferase class V-fold PLP-dependent enzyme [Virgibacillus sp. 179-BFC.A HS]MDY0404127.1 aminotransferase class V-fold PLP-dependent enzyme [Virgibacillus sp. 179-BFC.A HS]
MIYFDQAATSYPKPPEVIQAVTDEMVNLGGNPGRGNYNRADSSLELVRKTRETCAEIFGCSDPKKVIFCQNATMALNMAVQGFPWQAGDRVITTSVEHNSLRRPLHYIAEKYGVELIHIPWLDNRKRFLEQVAQAIDGNTKMLAITHASNVTGAILPLRDLLAIGKDRNLTTLVDASQTAGHMPITMQDGIDLLAMPGHKGLLGPQGTGLLLVEGDVALKPLLYGGTGSHSTDMLQPETWPEKMESGTLNMPGIAGLYAALTLYKKRISENVPRETLLAKQLCTGLNGIPNVKLYGPKIDEERMPIIAFNIDHVPSQEVAMILDSHYQIAVRAGLHCNPDAHQTMGTLDQGVVRASLGYANTKQEVEIFVKAVAEIAAAYENLQ